MQCALPAPPLPTTPTPTPTVFDTAYWTPLYPQPFSAADLEAGDVGKWLLFWKDPAVLERKWAEAQRAFDDGLLPGVTRMKMSTRRANPRASGNSAGVLVLYCDRSSDRDHIMAVGDVILWAFRYDESEYIFYKTDAQTGQATNHNYKSNRNPHYRPALVDQACEDCGVAIHVEA